MMTFYERAKLRDAVTVLRRVGKYHAADVVSECLAEEMFDRELYESGDFDVILESIPDRRSGWNRSSFVVVIKVLRELTNMGLKEAKDFVDTLPNVVMTSVSETCATYVRDRLEEAGGVAAVKVQT